LADFGSAKISGGELGLMVDFWAGSAGFCPAGILGIFGTIEGSEFTGGCSGKLGGAFSLFSSQFLPVRISLISSFGSW